MFFLMIIERFLFIFAITIPFDIRDMEGDRTAGLKTLPVFFGERKSLQMANISLIIFMIIGFLNNGFLVSVAMIMSGLLTFFIINNKKINSLPFFHYAILDGTIIMQSLLVISSFYLK